MDDPVQAYVDAIAPQYKPLFDRLRGLVLGEHPDASLVLSYGIPAYKVGRRSLFIGAWKHGISVYGWDEARDGGFLARHPQLKTSKGTIRINPDEAAGISDDEFRDLIRAALNG